MLTIFAPAKINLALDVLSKRPDGYHEVDMVMQTIALCDQLTLERSDRIELSCSNPLVPVDRRNLAWKAVELLKEETGYTEGVRIHITKKIPIAAGLAGGSADAAAVLLGLNQLWGLNLTKEHLMSISVKLGADVPFCILQGSARAQGIGERLTKITSPVATAWNLLLITPNIPVSTSLIYKKLIIAELTNRPKVSKVVTAFENGDFNQLILNWGNVLEEVALKEFPDIAQVKKFFQEFGLSNNLMSGSGPTVFSLNPSPDVIEPFLAAVPKEWFACFTNFKI